MSLHPIKTIDLPSLHAPLAEKLREALDQVMTHQIYVNGPEVSLFEFELAEFLGAHVLGVGNGTDALVIALLTLGIQPGDEILVPGFSYFASAEAVAHIGAIPVFVDIDPDRYTIDIHDASVKISPKTKGIIPVHMFGLCADMTGIMALAKEHGLYVIEDAAQAIGAKCMFDGKWTHASTIGDIGCISFYPSKNLGAFGDGGCIVSRDSNLLQKAREIAQHGQSTRYQHKVIGLNSRLDTLQAAILRVKLKSLVQWTHKRQEIADMYSIRLENLSEIDLPFVPKGFTHVFHQYTIRVAHDRDSLMTDLQQLGIPVRLYYPKPIHQQAAFLKFFAEKSLPLPDLAVTQTMQDSMLSLPIHPNISEQQIEYITHTIDCVLNKK